MYLDPLNAELNPICHLLALLGGSTVVVVSRLRVNTRRQNLTFGTSCQTFTGYIYTASVTEWHAHLPVINRYLF